MYDMDSTWGLYWNGSRFVSAEYRMQEDYEVGVHNTSNLLFDRLESLFTSEIKARYTELRAGFFPHHTSRKSLRNGAMFHPLNLLHLIMHRKLAVVLL